MELKPGSEYKISKSLNFSGKFFRLFRHTIFSRNRPGAGNGQFLKPEFLKWPTNLNFAPSSGKGVPLYLSTVACRKVLKKEFMTRGMQLREKNFQYARRHEN